MQLLTLPKSKLSLRDGELVKSGADDSIVARFPTDHIRRIAIEKTQAYGTAFSMVAALIALGVVAHFFISSPGWSWTAMIACAAGSGLVLMGIEGRELVIETTGGEARYPVVDLFEEAEGFVLSANALLGLGEAGADASAASQEEEKPLVGAEVPTTDVRRSSAEEA